MSTTALPHPFVPSINNPIPQYSLALNFYFNSYDLRIHLIDSKSKLHAKGGNILNIQVNDQIGFYRVSGVNNTLASLDVSLKTHSLIKVVDDL